MKNIKKVYAICKYAKKCLVVILILNSHAIFEITTLIKRWVKIYYNSGME